MPNLDLWPWLESLEIKTKNGRIKKLRKGDSFAWAQRGLVAEIERQYNAGLPVRILILKGRQLGCSTLTEAVNFFTCFLHPGTNALVLSRKDSESEYLFGMMKRFWESGPFKGLFNTKYDRQGYIEWNGLGSSITTETAKGQDVGRGRTLQAVHGSEVAFWPSGDEMVASLNEAIPYEHGTIVVYESTANGVGGYFYEEWERAVRGDSEFVPMFFPWWEHDEYEIRGTHLTYSELDEDERTLLEVYPKLNLAKLAWRRRKIASYTNPVMFDQEYPMSPEVAFISTGYNVFAELKLKACYVEMPEERGYLFNDDGRLAFKADNAGHLWVYKFPDPKRRYVIACDPTWTVDGDPAAIQVLDRLSMEQVAVWHGSADPSTVGEIALAMAYFYGPETILNTEVQGGGRAVLNLWREADYPNIWMDQRPDRPKKYMQAYGWNSTYETKKYMLGTVQGLIERTVPVIHHPATYYEMSRYVSNEDGTYGPSRRSGHDDTVISFGIAIMTIVTERNNVDYAALAAPGPGRTPGITPRLATSAEGGIYGTPVDLPIGDRFVGVASGDAMVGVDETY